MTIAQATTKALHLLDEVSTTSSAAAYSAKFPSFFDMAQREIALIRPIIKVVEITIADADDPKSAVESDMIKIEQITRSTDLDYVIDFYIHNGYIYIEDPDLADGDKFSVKYRAYPTVITDATATTTAFEVDAEAQDAIPFFAAANAVLPEDHALYVYLMGQYTNRLANLASGPKARARVVMRESGAWL